MEAAVKALAASLEAGGYVADRALATALHLALALEKPLLVEGPAGVGKTEAAKALAAHLGAPLIRLQCYEGLDASQALYEWNYPKQMLRVRLEEGREGGAAAKEREIFSEAYLLRRPLLEAITQKEASPVLLVDEIDRADEAFEAFLLEILSEFQVTIPELGTVRARHRPHVILTSNRTRDLSDALRRRCLYHWIPYPDPSREIRILKRKVPGLDGRLAEGIVRAVGQLRRMALLKAPGVAESLDWARALVALHREAMDAEAVKTTLGCILKDKDDLDLLLGEDGEALLTQVAASFPPRPADAGDPP